MKIYNETMLFDMPHIPLDNIFSVYVGKPDKCMCGCSGKHTYNSVNRIVASEERGYEVRDEEVNDKRVVRVYKKMIKNAYIQGIEVTVFRTGTVRATNPHEYSDYIYTMFMGKTQYTLYALPEEHMHIRCYSGKRKRRPMNTGYRS